METCLSERIVLAATEPITYADFLGNRNDVIVLASAQGIAALELDTRGTQNFHPISDRNGTFRVRDAASLYVQDGIRFFIIPL
jgi:hypothetical protein